MASGYLDFVRDIEGEKLIVLRDNPQYTIDDLVVEVDGVRISEKAKERVAKASIKEAKVTE